MRRVEYYMKGGIEPIDFITANNMSFLEGNIIKYVTRYKYKNGLEDLVKAADYLDRLMVEYTTERVEQDMEEPEPCQCNECDRFREDGDE